MLYHLIFMPFLPIGKAVECFQIIARQVGQGFCDIDGLFCASEIAKSPAIKGYFRFCPAGFGLGDDNDVVCDVGDRNHEITR